MDGCRRDLFRSSVAAKKVSFGKKQLKEKKKRVVTVWIRCYESFVLCVRLAVPCHATRRLH